MSNEPGYEFPGMNVTRQPDQPSGGSADPSTANLDRLRQFRSEDYEAARILAIRQDLHPLWLALLDPANDATRPALLEQLNQQFTALTGQERYWPPEWIRETLTIGGKTKEQLIGELEGKGYDIDDIVRAMMNDRAFTTLPEPESIDLVRLHVRDLGFSDEPTIDELYQRATELGLELCPAEVGPHYRLNHPDQPPTDWVLVGMQPITGADGRPRVFYVVHDGFGRWFRSDWARPNFKWFENDQLLLRLRKSAGHSEPLDSLSD